MLRFNKHFSVKLQDNKINIQNSVAFIHINSEPAGKEGREVISFIAIPSKVLRNRPSHRRKINAVRNLGH